MAEPCREGKTSTFAEGKRAVSKSRPLNPPPKKGAATHSFLALVPVRAAI